MPIEPVAHKRVSRSVIDQLVKLLADGELSPGDKLPSERELAERFHLSRPSVREALRVMEIIGLVETRPGGGSSVTDLNLMPFLSILSPLFFKDKRYETELLEFRIVLELRAVESAARNMVAGGDAPIAAALELMREALDVDDSELGVEADIAFHRAVFSLADNSIIAVAAELLSTILEFSVRSSRRRILERVDDREELYRQHREIWSALREGDSAKAAEAMRIHLVYALNFHFT